MPLLKGKKAATKEGISHNISAEEHAGKPHKQAIAIGLSEARKSGAHIPKPHSKSQSKRISHQRHKEHR